MLRGKHLLFSLLLVFLASATVFAQDGGDKKDKKKKEKTEKVKKEKKEKEEKVKEEKVKVSLDEYPYPEVTEDEYKEFVKEKNQEQQDKFLDGKYGYPAKPRHQTEIGIDVGPLWISGDVKAKKIGSIIPGFGVGGHIRRSFGYVFSIRGNFMMGTTHGANWQGSQGWSVDRLKNEALSGNSTMYSQFNEEFSNKVPDYRGLNNNIVFYNYETRIREASVSGVVNLNNIRFHQRRNKMSLYGLFGIGGVIYNTKMDQLDADGNEYDYDLERIFSSQGIDPADGYKYYDNRDAMYDALEGVWDGTYESQAERHFDDYWIFGGDGDRDNEWSYRPTAHVGLGLSFKITNRINAGLESRVTYTNDDLLDGQRWTEEGDLSRDYDTYVFTGAHLNFNLGRKNSVEPLWWMNPVDYAYSELDNEECCDNLRLEDADGDGVPDLFDEEPDSREDCPVDTRGRMLDSDGDGILDCDDCQPYTRRDLIEQIDDCGAAFEKCCVDTLIREIRTIEAPKPSCDDMGLPSILFDLNYYGVKPEFDPQLSTVANYLRSNPTVRLCVVGNTDNRSGGAYNDALSWKRANEVVNVLVSKFGVNRGQLAIQYRGETDPVVGGLSDTASKKGIDAQHALNRRVDFRCCMEGQYDMPMPSNAGNVGRK